MKFYFPIYRIGDVFCSTKRGAPLGTPLLTFLIVAISGVLREPLCSWR